MKILIVEDHYGIRYALEMFLELEGYRVSGVDRGEAALQLLQTEPFDLVLLDLNTDGMTASEFVTQLPQDQTRPKLGILSGSTGIEFEARKLGADFAIRKPFEHEDLMAAIRKTLAVIPTGLAQGVREENADLPGHQSAR